MVYHLLLSVGSNDLLCHTCCFSPARMYHWICPWIERKGKVQHPRCRRDISTWTVWYFTIEPRHLWAEIDFHVLWALETRPIFDRLYYVPPVSAHHSALSTQHSAAKTDLVVSVSWRVQTLFHRTLCWSNGTEALQHLRENVSRDVRTQT
jgi:hypothetical protein